MDPMPHMTTLKELEEKVTHSEKKLSLADSGVMISRSDTVVASSSGGGGEHYPVAKQETSCKMHQGMRNKETKAMTAMQMDEKEIELKKLLALGKRGRSPLFSLSAVIVAAGLVPTVVAQASGVFPYSSMVSPGSSSESQLVQWGMTGIWELCWSSAVHTNSVGEFHSRCDEYDESLVLVTNSIQGRVFGGFARGSWGGTSNPSTGSADSFVFGLNPTMQRWFPVNGGATTYINPDYRYLPMFGGNELKLAGRNGGTPGVGSAMCPGEGSTYNLPVFEPCGGGHSSTTFPSWGASTAEVYVRVPPCPLDWVAVSAATDGVLGFQELDGACGIGSFTIGTNTYLIIASNNDHLQIIDVSDPTSMSAVGALSGGGLWDVKTLTISGVPYAITTGSSIGVKLINLSDPASPQVTYEGFPLGVTAPGGSLSTYSQNGVDYAIIKHSESDGFGIYIVDISDPAAPALRGTAKNGQNGFTAWSTGSGDSRAFTIGASTYAIVAGLDAAQIVDISNPMTLVAVAAIFDGQNGLHLSGQCRSVDTFTVGTSVYAIFSSTGDATVQIVDLTTPAGPVAVSAVTDGADFSELAGVSDVDTFECVCGIDRSVFALAVGATDAGVVLMDVSDPTSPVAVAAAQDGSDGFTELNGPHFAHMFAINQTIYAAVTGWADDGVQLIRVKSCVPSGCLAGEYDHDGDLSTDCLACSIGKSSPAGATSCTSCVLGTADADNDPSTECEQCQPGFFSPAEATSCTHCAAGYIDHDSDPATPCNSTDTHLCPAGTHAAAGSTQCSTCPAGSADLDSNPATRCDNCTAGHFAADGSTSCDPCVAGTADNDLNASTPCEVCEIGEYSPQASTECVVCNSGTEDLDEDPSTPCINCIQGRADEDLNATTPCTICANGTFAAGAATRCVSCAAGRSDADSNAATACVACPRGQYNSISGRSGSCDECFAGRYAPAFASTAIDACEACSAGQFAANGSAACASCAPGTADEDNNPATQCSACPNGTYASCGGTECQSCPLGKSDLDFDPTTPCVDCAPGQYWDDGYADGTFNPGDSTAACVNCQAGQVDLDIDSITPCTSCPNAETSSERSTVCIGTGGQCTQLCPVGFEDADCSEATGCTECAPGQYTAGGFFSDQTQCQACPAGTYAPQGSDPSECTGCSIGTADLDANAGTACEQCSSGTYTADDANKFVRSNATQCPPCAPGSFDNDTDAGTACSACATGKANPDAGSVGMSACIPCAPGRWASLDGTPVCPDCPEGTYRGPDDLDGCVQCDAALGKLCLPGSSYPHAAAGYFAEITTDAGVNATTVVACIPFPFACLGTCSRAVTAFVLTEETLSDDDQGLNLASCGPGLEGQSCTIGYEGSRCSLCTPFNAEIKCSDTITNGFYRLESRCEPCPCTWITFNVMIVALFLGALGLMFALDLLGSEFADHASTLAAPLLILVSFAQTIAVFLDTGIPWPDSLRKLMLVFSFLNFNLELTRPDCAGDFGALKKVQVALSMPVFVGSVIAAYGLITLVRIHREADATAIQRHSARNQLRRKLASVATTLFTVGAIFFVKSFLRAFDCEASVTDSARSFMKSAPQIECIEDAGSDYPQIRHLSTVGLVVFTGCLVLLWLFLVRAHHSGNPGLGNLAFLGDKFEDHFYYWDLVIVARKVLLMSIFLLFKQLSAVLLATFLTIFSLSIHIATRPFEDAGTDWTELLSLAAQLITLVAGPAFVVLVRSPHYVQDIAIAIVTRVCCRASNANNTHRAWPVASLRRAIPRAA